MMFFTSKNQVFNLESYSEVVSHQKNGFTTRTQQSRRF
jgi:hypothetical protein